MENITPEEVEKFSPEEFVYVDIRGKIAYDHGHIPGAVCWDVNGSPELLPDGRKWILYCSVGENSVEIVQKLRMQGHDACNLQGGYRAWMRKTCHAQKRTQETKYDGLSPDELQKYDRQMILPQVGTEGQKKLKKARILIVGAGGLGAPAALYLAGAGVGMIGIMDADTVNASNLHRQIIHSVDRVNMNKTESAKIAMEQQNELVQVKTYSCFLTAENAEEIIREYDFIIDAVDNIETKFLINDTCVLSKKPFCHAGILQFQGQVMTYVPGEYPCYRCVFEEIPKEPVLNCSQAGILGAVAGIIGSVQALEAIKYILGTGGLLVGKMMVFDGLNMKIRIISYKNKNKACRVCGDKKEIYSVKENASEYTRQFCSI